MFPDASKRIVGEGVETWKAEPPSPHDLRRTLATRLASIGIPQEDVAAVLNHVRQDVTGRHYDKYRRLAEKRRALAAWESALSSIINQSSPQIASIADARRAKAQSRAG